MTVVRSHTKSPGNRTTMTVRKTTRSKTIKEARKRGHQYKIIEKEGSLVIYDQPTKKMKRVISGVMARRRKTAYEFYRGDRDE